MQKSNSMALKSVINTNTVMLLHFWKISGKFLIIGTGFCYSAHQKMQKILIFRQNVLLKPKNRVLWQNYLAQILSMCILRQTFFANHSVKTNKDNIQHAHSNNTIRPDFLMLTLLSNCLLKARRHIVNLR